MDPTDFPEANTLLTSSDFPALPVFAGTLAGGELDGANLFVTAWKPTSADLTRLAAGGFIYLSTLGSFPPTSLVTVFPVSIKNAPITG